MTDPRDAATSQLETGRPFVSTEATGREDFSRLLILINAARRGFWVFAVYDNVQAREEVIAEIKRAVAPIPVFDWTYSPDDPYPIHYLNQLTKEQKRERAIVFFFDLERGADQAWKSLDYAREQFTAHPHGLIFWVTSKGRVDAARKAPHFWAQRSVVFDFTVTLPEPQQIELMGMWAGRDLDFENYDEALRQLRLFQGLLDEYHTLTDSPVSTVAHLSGKVAQLLHYLDRRDEALPYLQEQFEIARRLKDREMQAEALANMAVVERIRSGKPKAIELLEQALSLTDRERLRADILYNLGASIYAEGHSEESLKHLDEALKLFTQVGAKLGQANVLKAIGDVQSFRKEMDAALASYAEARTLFQQVGSKLGQANVLKAIGDVQSFRDDQDAALASYAEARTLFQQVGDKLGQANVRLSTGKIINSAGEFEEAIRLYEEIGDRYSIARGKAFFGEWLLDQGETERAVKLLGEAREGWALIGYDGGVDYVDEILEQAGKELGEDDDE